MNDPQNHNQQPHNQQPHSSQPHSSQPYGSQPQTPPRKQGVEGIVSSLLAYGNSHTVKLYQPSGQLLFRVPLTWAAVLGLFALFTPLFVPALIAVAVLLVLKFRFSLTRDVSTPPARPSEPVRYDAGPTSPSAPTPTQEGERR